MEHRLKPVRTVAMGSIVACLRLGGEEFLVVLPSASLAEAASVAERLREASPTVPRAGTR